MNQPLQKQHVQVGDVQIELVRKRIRNLNLTVRGAQGAVRVSAPLRASEAEIRRFVISRLDWIERQRARLAGMPQAPVYEYKSGELHRYMGRNLRLQVCEGSRAAVRLNGDDTLHLHVPTGADAGQRRTLIEAWYREQLAERIPLLIARYEPVMSVAVAEWRIRKMKTRWGSCNIPRRRIWINLELARLPPACLEYIVVHEMTHLLERGHNARFYALMDRFMPHWRQPHNALRGHMMA